MFESKQTALELDFQTRWGTSSEVVFENMPSPAPDLFTKWVRWTLQYADADRIQIGGGAYRYPGVVMIQIFIKEGIGINEALKLADTASDLYRDQVISGVNFNTPYITKLPARDGWCQVQLTVPFYFDEVI